ncbi:MAG: chorion class high-cysteine HCB protein 13 [Christensenellales bacterium]
MGFGFGNFGGHDCCGCDICSLIFLLLLLQCCGCGNGFGMDGGCGCGSILWLILLLNCCCCGNKQPTC